MTLEDNIVNGLFCTTHTDRRRGHPPFVYAGVAVAHISTLMNALPLCTS